MIDTIATPGEKKVSTVEWESVNGPVQPAFGLDVLVFSEVTGEWDKGRRIGTGWVHKDSTPFRAATHWRFFVAPDATP
jgi:hypothetical protein